jgi:predicted transposase/invertase (TIGR01784 family)
MRYIVTHDGTELLMPNNDYVFKLIFADMHRLDLLKDLLKQILDLPDSEFEITLINTDANKEQPYDKFSSVDVRMTTPLGKILNIELQVGYQAHFAERIIFGLSKLITGQIEESEDWSVIKKTIGIAIIDFNMYEDAICHHRFRLYDKEAKVYFGDVEEVNTIELKKVGNEKNPELKAWVMFIGAKSEEDLMEAAEMNAGVKTACGTLTRLSNNRAVRDEYDRRLRFFANAKNEAYSEFELAMAEKDVQLAQQKDQLAQQKDQLAQQKDQIINMAAYIAELEQKVKGV